jgi:hypothetical protein
MHGNTDLPAFKQLFLVSGRLPWWQARCGLSLERSDPDAPTASTLARRDLAANKK